jgi:uncharacterized membrane protein HdeD (DUF308 family)
MPKKEMMHEDWGKHKKWMGGKLLILGILVLINVYWPMLTWPAFVGWVLVLAGVWKLIMMPMKR